MEELARLAETAGAEVLATLLQERDAPTPPLHFGRGKVDEVKELASALGATLVISDDQLTPIQERNVQRAGSNRGVRPYVSTGHLAVSVCPGGTRSASAGSTSFIRDLRDFHISQRSFAIRPLYTALHGGHATPAREVRSGRSRAV